MSAVLTVRPIATNPGGVVDPADLIGRETEHFALCRAVSTGGARVLGDRRMGKTSLLGAVEVTLRDVGHPVVRVSAETSDPLVFARQLVQKLRDDRLLSHAVAQWEREFGGELGVDVGLASLKLTFGAKKSAQPREFDLFTLCADAARRAGPHRVVFMFDEITTLATALADNDRPACAELFRALRVPRQQFDNVSVVLAGSIGLHHALTDFAVVNDIRPVTVGPLAAHDAQFLARCLLRGAGIAADDEAATASRLAEHCAGVPFYLHMIVEALVTARLSAPTPADIDGLVTRLLEDPVDEWELRHYEDRLVTYYGSDATLVGHIIDCYALAPAGLTLDQLLGKLAAVDLDTRPDRVQLVGLVERLEADHYIVREGRTDRIANALLARAWRAIRRLA